MKLTAVSGTYTPIIAGSIGDSLKQTGDPDFSDYTAVPEEYTKVAYHTSSTDTGTNATGSNLTTTYRAYISPTQPAGTYVGQVKYTLVHPNDRRTPGIPASRQVQVTYNAGIRGYFDDDTTVKTNVVVYNVNCETGDKEYEVVKSQNLDDDGNKVSSLTTDDGAGKRITIQNASKLKVILNYDFAFNEGNNDGENGLVSVCSFDNDWVCQEYYGTGSQTIIINGNMVDIDFGINNEVSIDSSHDYGFYARVYPLNENDEEYIYKEYFNCVSSRVSGTYKEPKSIIDKVYYWFDGWGAGPGIGLWYDEDELMQDVLPNVLVNEITANASWVR